MKDPTLIDELLHETDRANQLIHSEFALLSLQDLNWKPSTESWSIGQCIDHLVVSDCQYFTTMRKIAENKNEMTNWERWSPLGGLFGRMLLNQTQEKVKRKLNAPKVFIPSSSNIDIGIIERFFKHQDTLREYLSAFKTVDLDRTKITSPVSKLVTYNLRNAIKILVQHQHRHIRQAMRVKELLKKSLSAIAPAPGS